MRPIWLSPVALSALSLLAISPATNATETWPGFRGPDPALRDVLPDAFGLSVDWSRDLGFGYSSMAVANGLVVTGFTSGEDDVLAAFDIATGDEKWRTVLAPKYTGHDGSTDGPIATPTIAGDSVYMLGASGQLVALSLSDGTEQWKTQLDESNSVVPFYGYTSSPLVTDELVVVATGGDGRAVSAFDRETGEVRWTAGDDTATYQAAVEAELAGQRQIVAVTDQVAWGLDPSSGDVLWSFRHTEGNTQNTSSHPTVIDGNRVLLDLDTGSQMLTIQKSDDGFTAEEVWTSRAFARTFVLPIHHEGHLYGFTGQILTSVDAETGEINWRSRGTTSQNLAFVDGQLAILDASGELVLVAADPSGYQETTRVTVFDAGDYADAAFASNRFYLRNLQKLAAVRVDPDAAPTPQADTRADDPLRLAGVLGEQVKAWEKLPVNDRQPAVDAWFEHVESLPITADNGLATVVHRGAAQDVAITGTIFGWQGRTEQLHRLEGTDLAWRSFELDPQANYEYGLSIDFEAPAPDPANPNRVDYPFGPVSELRMPGWRPNPHLAEPEEGTPRGQVERFQFHSAVLDSTRQVRVYLPATYNAGAETAYPLLVIHHGDQAQDFGMLPNILDRMIGQSVEPVVALMVPRNSGAEFNGPQAGDFLKFLTTELLPHVATHYNVTDEAARRGVMGVGSAGVVSLHAALAHPGTFGKIATQSFYLGDANRDTFWELIEGTEAKPELVWVETGPNDYDIPQNGIDAERSSRALIERLEARGINVRLNEVHGTAGWAGWRGQTDQILEAFFPAPSGG